MPSKNVVKQFDNDSYYHVYNRGNNKRQIFFDDKDYAVFLSYLKYALLSDEEHKAMDVVDKDLITHAQQFNLRRLGLAGRLELVSYCLMPNHFHLLFFQHDKEAISTFMRSISTGYVMYFNQRYDCSGSLFQGTYKASKISNDSYLQHISRYIHLNALDVGSDFREYDYSSYKYFSQEAQANWISTSRGMDSMNVAEYEKFIVDWIPQRKNIKQIQSQLANL